MVRRGHVPDTKAAFTHWLRDGGPAYVATETVTPEEAIGVVNAAGGAVVLAHPKQLRVDGMAALEEVVRGLAAAGLAGLEVVHPSHGTDDRAAFAAMAARLGLVASGGSDFHGDAKPDVRLGSGKGDVDVRYATWEAIRARCASWRR
jgi:predicted metal-dependent phosphoesterase TrpH